MDVSGNEASSKVYLALGLKYCCQGHDIDILFDNYGVVILDLSSNPVKYKAPP